MHPFLIEIGTEELPPLALQRLAQGFCSAIEAGLGAAKLAYTEVQYYATPRRLAVRVGELVGQQATQTIERRGPALQAAYDTEGNPTPACLGFAKSCGVEVSALHTLETDKGQWVAYQETHAGKMVQELLPSLVSEALARLPIPKRMRWGGADYTFARPVHWVLMLYGNQVITAKLFGKRADKVTFGHRFHHPQAISIEHPDDYVSALTEAKVIVDFGRRRDAIKQQILTLAEQHHYRVRIEPTLLDEVTALVEWPNAFIGNFDNDFLSVPPEALIAAMQDHQRYFPVTNADGTLLPHFISVANIESTQPKRMHAGNERVLRARLADAAFFYTTDKQQSLITRRSATKHVILQRGLGTLWHKSERLLALCDYLHSHVTQNERDDLLRAATLAKCDLMTDMVGEFPELQGIMGQYYAQHNDETEAVGFAIREHYLPRFAGDDLPTSTVGTILALADRIDHLIGIFGINQLPSGVKDPYKLRRAALGVIRLIIEKNLSFPLVELLTQAQHIYAATQDTVLPNINAAQQVHEYILERLRHWYQEKNIPLDVINAVLSVQNNDLYDTQARIAAVLNFYKLPEAQTLITAHKRVHNLLRQTQQPGALRIELLQEPAEKTLADLINAKQIAVDPFIQQKDYHQALQQLATLGNSVDAFFDQVMVMVEDTTIRENRLALLNQLRTLFSQIADIGTLQ